MSVCMPLNQADLLNFYKFMNVQGDLLARNDQTRLPSTNEIQQHQYSVSQLYTNSQQPQARQTSVPKPIQNTQTIKQHLNLQFFKVLPCELTTQHNHKQCIYFHGPKDRRRQGVFHNSEMCQYSNNGENGINCIYGEQCLKSHNKVESLYQIDKYKKKFCTLYPGKTEACEYGIYCSFAHDEGDIQIELIHNLVYDHDFYLFHYKTVWCPFNYVNHDRANCVYAHNWQDFRRKMTPINYQPITCPYWKTNKVILQYEHGCPNLLECIYCHGWKELEYHPLIFKMKKCTMGLKCVKGTQCPYYHDQSDKIQQSSLLNKSVPRNRIIDGVFKQPTDFQQLKDNCPITTNKKAKGKSLKSRMINLQEQNDQNKVLRFNDSQLQDNQFIESLINQQIVEG